MKKLIISTIIMIGIFANMKSILIGSMDIIDFIGYKTNTPTIEIIDLLNEIYYSI